MPTSRRTVVRALTLGAATAATLLVAPTAAHADRLPGSYAGYDGHPGAHLPVACNQAATSGGEVVCTYRATGGEQYFDVPKATPTTQLTIDAIGARGGTKGAALGGQAGRVKMIQTFNSGQRLYVEVGTPGQSNPGLAGAGGFNGGGGGAPGQTGGGGATDIRSISRTSLFSLESRVLVAGGGGGGCKTVTTTTNGGAAGRDGVGSDKTTPGRGATNGPGVGGHTQLVAAGTGKLGQGGNGAVAGSPGCGGGGGWYGGGGSVARSGAGGGSNYPLATPASTLTSKDAIVVIRYTPKLGKIGVPGEFLNGQRWVFALQPGLIVQAGTPLTATMTLRNVGGAAMSEAIGEPLYYHYVLHDRQGDPLIFVKPGTYTVYAADAIGTSVLDVVPITVVVLPER